MRFRIKDRLQRRSASTAEGPLHGVRRSVGPDSVFAGQPCEVFPFYRSVSTVRRTVNSLTHFAMAVADVVYHAVHLIADIAAKTFTINHRYIPSPLGVSTVNYLADRCYPAIVVESHGNVIKHRTISICYWLDSKM